MGTTLTGTTPQDTYDSLIKVTDNGPLSSTGKYLSDGLGNDSVLALSTARVGVGKIPDTYRLDLNAADGNIARFSYTDADATFEIAGPAVNTIKIGAASGDALALAAGGTEAMRITAAGSVGIGTTSPLALQPNAAGVVARALEVSGSGSAGIRIVDTSITNGALDISSDNGVCEIGAYYSTSPTLNLNAAGTINFKKENTTIATITGSGLTFNGDTAAANALDDYEEGTWTMGVSFGGASAGVTTLYNTGTYTKIGRKVTVNGYLALTSKGSSTGAAKITGLPFTIPNSTSNYSAASLFFENVTFTDNSLIIGGLNTTTLELYQILSTTGTVTALTDTNFSNNSGVIVSFTYFV